MRRTSLAVVLWVAGCTEPNPFQGDSGGSESSAGPSSGGDPTSAGTSMTTSASSTVGDDETSVGPTTDGPSDTTTVDPTDPDTGEPTCAHSCVALPPGDWEGPVAVLHDAPDDPGLSCAAQFDEPATLAFANLDAPAASCACDCEAPTGLSCTPVTVERHTSVGCGSEENQWYFGSSCSASVEGAAGKYWRATAEVDEGHCEPIEVFDVPDAGFGDRYAACGSSKLDTVGCQPGTACVPSPEAPYDGRLCLWHSGDLQCPSDTGYGVRTVYYGDFADARGCESCTCGDAEGDCDGGVYLFNEESCAGTPAQQLTVGGACVSAGLGIDSAQINAVNPLAPLPSTACPSSDSQPIGEAEGIDAVTFCCDS